MSHEEKSPLGGLRQLVEIMEEKRHEKAVMWTMVEEFIADRRIHKTTFDALVGGLASLSMQFEPAEVALDNEGFYVPGEKLKGTLATMKAERKANPFYVPSGYTPYFTINDGMTEWGVFSVEKLDLSGNVGIAPMDAAPEEQGARSVMLNGEEEILGRFPDFRERLNEEIVKHNARHAN